MMRRFPIGFGRVWAFAALLCLSALPARAGDILAVAEADGRFTTLLSALQATGLDSTLQGEGPFTLFAPTDDAFGALAPDRLEALMANPDGDLRSILLYHVVPGAQPSDSAGDAGGELQTALEGERIAVGTTGELRTVNGARVIVTDIEGDNGVIHVIDTVLMPR